MTRSHLSVAAVLALCTAWNCVPSPVPVTRTLSPRIDGMYEREDGTAVAGARMLLSIEPRDSVCAQPRATAVTDSAGRFSFAAIRRREHAIPVMFDRLLCVQVCGEQNGTALPGYRGCTLHDSGPVTVLRCVEARQAAVPDRPRLACWARVRRNEDLAADG